MSAAADGTLTLEDKRDGRRFEGLNRIVDGGDRGDEYNYCAPERDEIVDRPERTSARVVEAGAARWTLEIASTYSLPESLSEKRNGRSDERVECAVVSRARLYPGVERVDIETEIDNRARDHRLRAHFPTGVRAEETAAEQHFGVVRRAVALPEDDGTWLETPVGTYPQKAFVDVSDGARGFTLANRGLPEYEALREGEGTVTLALTLLRCVGWLSRSDFPSRKGQAGPPMETPGAQMPGRWRFEYSLIPHAADWSTAFGEAHRAARPLGGVRTERGDGSLAPSASLVEVEPAAVVVSALKAADDGEGVIVRVYNISDGAVEGRLRLTAADASAELVNLNEEPLGPAETVDGWVRLSLRRNEIATLRFR